MIGKYFLLDEVFLSWTPKYNKWTRALGLVVFTVTCSVIACKARNRGVSRAKSSDSMRPTLGAGGHELLPQNLKSQALARAEQLRSADSKSASINAMALNSESSGRQVCSSALEDVHCYADACAMDLGGNLEENYMPEGIDPRKPETGEEIKVYWNKKQITWQEYQGTWQYLFDGKPGAKDWPEKAADLTAPVTDSSFLKCDFMQDSNSSTCLPTQKRATIKKGGTTWVYLFRRDAPVQPGVDADDPRHIDNWGNVAIVGYKTSTGKVVNAQGNQTSVNGVCWFNTFNKTNSGMTKKPFPIPVPGGRFGNSESEQKRRAAAIAFFDTPSEHRTLTAYFGGIVSNEVGDNCVTCHGNGPVLDSSWYREHKGEVPGDDRLPFYSGAGLHNPRTFWKTEGVCAECHNYMSQKTKTCSDLARSYTSVTSSRLASKFRQGFAEDTGSESPATAPLPAKDKMIAAHTMLMPSLIDDDKLTVSEYSELYGKDIEEIINCCNGNCKSPTFTVKAPVLVAPQGAALRVPRVPAGGEFVETLPMPAKAVDPKYSLDSCASGSCDLDVTWRDAGSVYFAPERWYTLSAYNALSESEAASLCAKNKIGSSGNPANLVGKPNSWSGSYSSKVTVSCTASTSVVICGEFVGKGVVSAQVLPVRCN